MEKKVTFYTISQDDERLLEYCKKNDVIVENISGIETTFTGKRKHILHVYAMISMGAEELEYFDEFMRQMETNLV